MFRRFAFLFGGLILLFLAAISVILFLAFGPYQAGLHRPGPIALVACVVPLVFLLLVFALGSLAFRRVGAPLAEIMSAADAVAGGDLSVRVNPSLPGEFGPLAASFNHMTEELSRAEQQRRSLTADVAHELRNPLHVIQGNLEGMLDGVYEPTPETLTATLEETRLLARLVSDLQTLSLAEAGQLPLHQVGFSAADLIADVATSFSGQAAEAGVDLQWEAAGQGPELELNADYDRLDQVLSNLVANALRYTPSGGRITLLARPSPAGVTLEVADTGEGIPPEDLAYIFDRFWRGDRARTHREGVGSGLGLAIARQLVQAHGGAIRAASAPGQGTTFTIELPRAYQE